MNKATYLLLREADTEFLTVLWCDYANMIRGKSIHKNLFLTVNDFPVSISKAQLGVSAIGDYVIPASGYIPVGEIFLRPDWETLRVLPYLKHFASVYADMYISGIEFLSDPRVILKNAIRQLSGLGLELKVAFENEFTLFDSKNGLPVDRSLFAMPNATFQNAAFILELSDALERQGLKVERYYPESGFGQYEISTSYTNAAEAADHQILFRQTVHGVSQKFGYMASFLPKLSETQAGNGCHIHFSLWKDRRNLFDGCFFRPNQGEAEFFVQGILQHLSALMVLTAPTPNSYRRIKPHCWSGAFQCWGIDNREAAIRAITQPSGVIDHFELKTCDATANPFLALAGLIFCGIDGINNRIPLLSPCTGDPGNDSEEDLCKAGISRLPTSLYSSIERFTADTVLQQSMGEEFVRAFLAIRREEQCRIETLSFEEEVALLRERY